MSVRTIDMYNNVQYFIVGEKMTNELRRLICELIRAEVNDEDPRNPLTDTQLTRNVSPLVHKSEKRISASTIRRCRDLYQIEASHIRRQITLNTELKKIVAQEEKVSPFSNQQLIELLLAKGYKTLSLNSLIQARQVCCIPSIYDRYVQPEQIGEK